jgi:hypothetical protein
VKLFLLLFCGAAFWLFYAYPLLALFIFAALCIVALLLPASSAPRRIVRNAFFANHGRAARPFGDDSASIKGDAGEDEVRAALSGLDEDDYAIFHDLTLPSARGYTQIDHIVVSEFGVFVIETKNYRGWIFGKRDNKNWTQSIYNQRTRRAQKQRFQNPLHQNYGHIKAVEEFCNLAPEQIFSVVVFLENCEFKTPMPENVIFIGDLLSFIADRQTPLISAEKLTAVINRLYTAAESGAAAA